MKTILVTGATGFVGSHTLRWLTGRRDLRVIAACRSPERLFAGFDGEIRVGDLRDPSYVQHLLKDVDVVIHAMSWSSLFAHAAQSDALFYQPSLQLIEAFSHSATATRFVNVSTLSAGVGKGSRLDFWPHLSNIVRLEKHLQGSSSQKTFVNMRLGLFVGSDYGLGLLPILLPRLRTHLVPWVGGGHSQMPLTDGRDLGQALGRAALCAGLAGYESFEIVGPHIPSVRDVLQYVHEEFGYPLPHYNVSFTVAYAVGWLFEKLDTILPWEPLLVRSIVHLLKDTHASNRPARRRLGYRPQYDWRDSVRLQIAEIHQRQTAAMSMTRSLEAK